MKLDVTEAFRVMTEVVADMQTMLDDYVPARGSQDLGIRLKEFIAKYHHLLSLANEAVKIWIHDEEWKQLGINDLPIHFNGAMEALRCECAPHFRENDEQAPE